MSFTTVTNLCLLFTESTLQLAKHRFELVKNGFENNQALKETEAKHQIESRKKHHEYVPNTYHQ
jgi:hypothetical protein